MSNANEFRTSCETGLGAIYVVGTAAEKTRRFVPADILTSQVVQTLLLTPYISLLYIKQRNL